MKRTQQRKQAEQMKAILYTRVSTGRQAREGDSLDAQELETRRYAERKGFTVCEVVTDAGISGRSTKRPGFQRVMDAVRAREVDAVVVYSLSRFGRSMVNTVQAIEEMQKRGVQFHSVREYLDPTTATGKLQMNILAAFAQMVSDQIGEQVSSTWQYRKERGERTSHAPYGMTVAPGSLKLIPHPVESKGVDLIKRKRAQGATFKAIAADLGKAKIPNKAGRVKWTASQVFRIAVSSGVHTAKTKGTV